MSARISLLQAMQMAVHEARKGWGRARPNPHVGCVILSREGHLLSTGFHKKFGGPHAEVEALNALASQQSLKDATIVVTLEPCAHEGKTGSCAKALAKLPIKEVIYGLIDPNPLVAGQGIEILRAAGIKVSSLQEVAGHSPEYSVVERSLVEVTEHFLWNFQRKLPFVALKVATTLDGIMAHQSGESKWITGESARTEVHRLRAGFAAMLIGKNTFLTDNPYLNVRHDEFKNHANKVIVLDSSGSGLLKLRESHLYKAHAPKDIYWVVDESFENTTLAEELGINLIYGPVATALPQLYKEGIDSIMVEGGSRVFSYFIEHELAQRMYHFISPQIAGAAAGVPWTSQLKLDWDARIRLRDTVIEKFDDDFLLTSRF